MGGVSHSTNEVMLVGRAIQRKEIQSGTGLATPAPGAEKDRWSHLRKVTGNGVSAQLSSAPHFRALSCEANLHEPSLASLGALPSLRSQTAFSLKKVRSEVTAQPNEVAPMQ